MSTLNNSTRKIFWVVSFLTVVVCCLVFARFASFTKGIPDKYKIENKLRILTYASFVEENSAGSFLLEKFKKDCLCKVEVSSVVDSGLLLERLRLASKDDGFDLVIGPDQILIEKAKEFSWRQLGPDLGEVDEELKSSANDNWLAFDWSPLTFIYRKDEVTPATNFMDLLVDSPANKVSLEDPRTSALGQQFLLWLLSTTGEIEEFSRVVHQLSKDKIKIAPTWSISYSAFRQKQTQYVFTYLTSLIFHWETEKNENFQAHVFSKGHPFQVEYLGIPGNARNIELAEKMIKLILSDEGQKVIMERNFMLPVRKKLKAGTAYEKLPDVKLLDANSVRRDISILQSAQEIWFQVF